MAYRRKGFTLIELIIVVIIVAIIAAIAVPIMQGMKHRAIATEAVAGMSAVRTALQQYYLQYGDYHSIASALVAVGNFTQIFPGLSSPSDLQGTYFGKECYAINPGTDGVGIQCFIAPVWAGGNSATHASETADLWDSGSGVDKVNAYFYILMKDSSAHRRGIKPDCGVPY